MTPENPDRKPENDFLLETPVGVGDGPIPPDEIQILQRFCDKLDTAIGIFQSMAEQLQEIRSYYAAEFWMFKPDATRALKVSERQLSDWMKSDMLWEGTHYYDSTSPGSGSPRWVINVPRTKKVIATSGALRLANRQLTRRKRGRPRKNSVSTPTNIDVGSGSTKTVQVSQGETA